jgi:peptidyl-prolyl cis-trans isomerase SurA
MRSQVLDRLVLEEIQAQHADRAGIKVSTSRSTPRWRTSPSDRTSRSSSCRENWRPTASTTPPTAPSSSARSRARSCAQRDVVQRINITPRELDQYLEHQKKTASASNEYNVSHILIAVAQDATPAQLAPARARGARHR